MKLITKLILLGAAVVLLLFLGSTLGFLGFGQRHGDVGLEIAETGILCRLDHSQVIAQMRLPGRLDAGQGASHGRHGEKAILHGEEG